MNAPTTSGIAATGLLRRNGKRSSLTNRLQVGSPTHLFDTSVGLGANRYVPSHDGRRFLLSVDLAHGSAAQIVIVLNWADHLDSILRAR